jgi:4-diphosphocytidyl-2-C-methyl-D-erythritol kinase
VSRKELTTLGASLGSDVPFFFAQPSAWCTGRGEITSPMPAPRAARWALLVFPPMGLSTAAVYRRFDEMAVEGGSLGSDISPSLPATAQNLPNLRSIDLLPQLRNDLEPPAFSLAPDLAECREAIERFLGRPVRMSGSGSTLFTLFDEATEAASASRKALERFGSLRFAAVELSPEPDDAYNLVDIV